MLLFPTLWASYKPDNLSTMNTVDLVIFACLEFREFVVLGLFTNHIIRELWISMIGSAHNNNFREILNFANLSLRISRNLKSREYYQIYSIKGPNLSIILFIIWLERLPWTKTTLYGRYQKNQPICMFIKQ